MVKLSDLKVGQVFTNVFEGITRDLLKQYAKASGDTNPIHINDDVAKAAGLKGVIAHGLFSFGFISKLFEDLLEHGKYGKIIDVKQTTFTKVDIKDSNGNLVKQFEAGERGYISDKDIKRGLIKTKEVDEGILTYRERVATPGKAIIKLFE
jgi:hypothetical protein